MAKRPNPTAAEESVQEAAAGESEPAAAAVGEPGPVAVVGELESEPPAADDAIGGLQ